MNSTAVAEPGGPDSFTMTGVVTRLRGAAESVAMRLSDLEQRVDPFCVNVPTMPHEEKLAVLRDTAIQSHFAAQIEETITALGDIESRIERLFSRLDS